MYINILFTVSVYYEGREQGNYGNQIIYVFIYIYMNILFTISVYCEGGERRKYSN
jgi:hypothetical protein